MILEKKAHITLLTLSVILIMTQYSSINAMRGVRALSMAQDFMANGLLRRLSTSVRVAQDPIRTSLRETQEHREIQMQKDSIRPQLKTRGFRPATPIDTTKLHTLKLPKKVEYVDEARETFKAPPGLQESIDKSLRSRGIEQSSQLDAALGRKK